jgi:hypothetical protein
MTMQVVRGGRSKPVGVVLDSPGVRQMIAVAGMRDQSPGEFRKEFFEAMDRSPHISVMENTRVRVVEISRARCDYAHPEATITFVRAVVLKGRSKGQQVWICRSTNSLPFEHP